MEPSNNAIEYLFDCLYHNKPEKVEGILPKAKQQLDELYNGLTIVEKRKVTFLTSFLSYCEQEKWQQAKNQLEAAEEEYRRIFLHKIRTIPKQGFYEMHGKEMKSSPNSGTPENDKRVRIESTGSKRSSANKTEQAQRGILKTPTSSGSKRGTPVVMKNPLKTERTDPSKVDKPSDIAAMFESIYQNEWLAAAEELREFKLDEKTYSSFLLNIVFEAFKLALMESENQMGRLQTAAFTVLNGDFTYEGNKHKGDIRYLKQYRKSIAGISIAHLQETFKKRYLPEISRGIGIYQHIRVHGAIDRYTDIVVTTCWWMAVQVPSMYICDDRSKLNTFDTSNYRFYSRTGIAVDFYIWPALKEAENGALLAKGVAEPKPTHLS